MQKKDLLLSTLSVQSHSGQEDVMIAYIQKFVANNVPNATVEVKDRNVYVTKGDAEYYPCIVSHTDTVHKILADFAIYERNDVLFAYSSDTETQVGIGGDDKVGVWIGLQMLLEKDAVKCAFFHSEEIGCVGSSDADMDFFKDVGYCFQSDRRGNRDFVNNIYQTQLFGNEFSSKISPVIKSHGYTETSGALTDVYQLKLNGLNVCVANMSSGYYAPHTDKEVVSVSDAINCCDMISNLIDLLGCNLYEHTAPSYDRYDWWSYPTKKSKKKKKKKNKDYSYVESYDNLGYAYINGKRVGDVFDDPYDTYEYEDDNLLTHAGNCQWCDSKVYTYDEGQEHYCIGCDAIVDETQIIKL